MSLSWRKKLTATSLNMTSKNQVSTTICWTKMHIPSLTPYWNRSKWCTDCCHATWPSKDWYELSDKKCPCIFTHYEVLFVFIFLVQFSDMSVFRTLRSSLNAWIWIWSILWWVSNYKDGNDAKLWPHIRQM